MAKALLLIILALFQFEGLPIYDTGSRDGIVICAGKKKNKKKGGRKKGKSKVIARHTGNVETMEERAQERINMMGKPADTPQMYKHEAEMKARQVLSEGAAERGFMRHLESQFLTEDILKTRDQRGYTLLHYAAMNGYHASAKLLLDKGADPTLKDRQGLTALDWARQKSDRRMMTLLEIATRQNEDDTP